MSPPPKAPPRKGPRVADANQIRDRARGALMGLAVGDALGTTHESRQLPAPPYPDLADGPQHEMRGGGPFNVEPGQVTDDTQMASCLATSLKELKKFDEEDVATRYVEWRKHAFDIGVQTKAVLEMVAGGMLPTVASREVWRQSAKHSAGNGSLMRTAPIGVFFAKQREARIKASLDDAAITHFDPRCQLAGVIFNGTIAAAIHAPETPQPEAMLRAGLSDLSVGAAMLGRQAKDDVLDVREAVETLKTDLEVAQEADPELYGPELFLHRMAGFVRVAMRMAYWHLFHAKSFETALVDVINRGGDSDTNAAITGALLGAVYGESAIPEDWRTPVTEALAVKRGPLWDVYHPNQLMLLVD